MDAEQKAKANKKNAKEYQTNATKKLKIGMDAMQSVLARMKDNKAVTDREKQARASALLPRCCTTTDHTTLFMLCVHSVGPEARQEGD